MHTNFKKKKKEKKKFHQSLQHFQCPEAIVAFGRLEAKIII
jgi:hypothetical protein